MCRRASVRQNVAGVRSDATSRGRRSEVDRLCRPRVLQSNVRRHDAYRAVEIVLDVEGESTGALGVRQAAATKRVRLNCRHSSRGPCARAHRRPLPPVLLRSDGGLPLEAKCPHEADRASSPATALSPKTLHDRRSSSPPSTLGRIFASLAKRAPGDDDASRIHPVREQG